MRTFRALLVPVGVIITIGVIGAIIYTFIESGSPVPTFSSSLSESDEWWTSENTNVQAMAKSLGSNYTGEEPVDKLPVADITIHHGDKDGKTTPDDSCFVAFSYFTYPLDSIEAAHAEYENRKNAQSEAVKLDSITETLDTFEGNKEYELRRYNYVIDGQDILSGYEIGFVSMSQSHIRIEGVCKTPENLDLLTPVIKTVTLSER